MEGHDYDALASTVKIEDITTDDVNRDILRKLKENDPNFDKLWVYNSGERLDDCDYCPGGAHEFGWLGYFIGQNTMLEEFYWSSNQFQWFNSAIEPFCMGVNLRKFCSKAWICRGEKFSNRCVLFSRITATYLSSRWSAANLVLGVINNSHWR